MDKLTINHNFSKHARSYDEHSYVQRACADRLLKLLGNEDRRRILEIGCGTGSYTRLLRTKFPVARIDAVDISPEMVNIARHKTPDKNIQFSVEDGESVSFTGKYDLVTSNASFQWFQDFSSTVKKLAETLDPRGILCFSMYGPDTFTELREVLNAHYGSRSRISSTRFLSANEVRSLMEAYFKEITLEEVKIPVVFSSLLALLSDIKNSGTRGEGLKNNVFMGKNAVIALEKAYLDKFKGITATHHVYFCHARL